MGQTPINAATDARHASRIDAVTASIGRAAANSGVDFAYLLGQARLESGLDPRARASTSSAAGLFQFTRQTWLATLDRHGADHGLQWAANAIERRADGAYTVRDAALRAAILDLRDDPDAASAMAAAFASDNAEYLETYTGSPPEPVDLYLAHFLGPAGARQFLAAWRSDPDTPAAPLLPAAAQANRPIFFTGSGEARSVGDIRARFAERLQQGATPPLSPPSASPGIRRQNDATRLAGGATMRGIEPMPQRLSLDFARAAYTRLASLPVGSPS